MARAKLFLVRHAQAVSRSEWPGDDRQRPLSERGQRQADELVSFLAPEEPVRIASSPAVRCLDTVAPLAGKLGLDVKVDARLLEMGPADQLDDPDLALRLAGRAEAAITDLLAPRETVVVCSHGDLIPAWLEMVRARDRIAIDPSRCAKASVWELSFKDDRCVRSRYHRAPAVSGL